MSRLLVVTAVPAERDALGITAHAVGVGITAHAVGVGVAAHAVGVGVAAAAAGTARLLATGDFEAVVSVGIGGGFAARITPGGTAIGTESVAADLGAESPDGFIPLSELGFGADRYPVDKALVEALTIALPEAVVGPILTVSTVTGTAASTAQIARRHPDAVAEAMEGFGVATAAAGAGVPFAEIRTISNLVGPRDRGAWRIPEALEALAEVGRVLGRLGS